MNRRVINFIILVYIFLSSLKIAVYGNVSLAILSAFALAIIPCFYGWSRIFPVFICQSVIFWSVGLFVFFRPNNFYMEMPKLSFILLSIIFSALSFLLMILIGDKIHMKNDDNARPTDCVCAAIFGCCAHIWPLYVSKFRNFPTPIALFISGIFTELSIFVLLAVIFKSKSYVGHEETR